MLNRYFVLKRQETSSPFLGTKIYWSSPHAIELRLMTLIGNLSGMHGFEKHFSVNTTMRPAGLREDDNRPLSQNKSSNYQSIMWSILYMDSQTRFSLVVVASILRWSVAKLTRTFGRRDIITTLLTLNQTLYPQPGTRQSLSDDRMCKCNVGWASLMKQKNLGKCHGSILERLGLINQS